MAITPLDSKDKSVTVQAGESANLEVTFSFQGTAIVKANIISLTLTLFNLETSAIINGRNAQNVLDVNNGTVATDGKLTLRLGPLDNVIVGTVITGMVQVHVARFTWTWTDGVATRTGIEDVLLSVEKLAAPV